MFELICMLFVGTMIGTNVSIPFVAYAVEYRRHRSEMRRWRESRMSFRENLL